MSTPCSDTLTHPQHPGFSDGVTGLPPPVTVVFPFKRVAKSSSARISGLGLASSGICTGQPVIALECRGANPFPTWNTSPQKACCIVGYRRRYIMIHHIFATDMMCWILMATGNASSPTGFRLSPAGSRCDFTCNMQRHFDIHIVFLVGFLREHVILDKRFMEGSFNSQTADYMDRRKAEFGRKREREEKKEDQGRDTFRSINRFALPSVIHNHQPLL